MRLRSFRKTISKSFLETPGKVMSDFITKRWTLYIIESESGKLYTGITNDLEKRLADHKSKKGAKFFRTSPPKKVLYTECYPDRSSASKREAEVKKMSRAEKLKLIPS